MIKTGKVHIFEDNLDTDQIIPSQYLVLPTVKDMVKHAMEPIKAEFYKSFDKGDIIVGGRNFGCGSSREQAVAVLKEMGVACIISESFARIFYRNCINLGIPVIEINNTKIFENGDIITVDFIKGIMLRQGDSEEYKFEKYSQFVKELIHSGGLVQYFQKVKK